MFKKHKKSTSHVTVHRPHILDVGLSNEPNSVRAIPGAVGEGVTSIILALVTALVVVAGTPSQAASSHSHLLGTIYNSSILIHPLAPKMLPKPHRSTLPELESAPIADKTQPTIACAGKTVMNIVAHEDDDLLFLNPAINQDLAQHKCVRTVYITAGDDGRGAAYLQQREAGSRAAYNVMLHTNAKAWSYQSALLFSGLTIATASPEDNPDVSLLFLRLPDGNLNGEGFMTTGYQSITQLKSGNIGRITSVDRGQAYTSSQLVDMLTALLKQYQPVRINTQANDSNLLVADHSDHITTGEFATLAAAAYTQQTQHRVAVHYFMGYPIRAMLPNLSTADVAQKSAAFFAYAAYDPSVCASLQVCMHTQSSYGFYLQRQYLGEGQ